MRLSLLEVSGSRLVFRVHCSKGTYIRTLVEDIAKSAGTVAHTAKLHRESVGSFRAEDMLDMSGAERVAEDGPGGLRTNAFCRRIWHFLAGPIARSLPSDEDRFCGGQAVACDQEGAGLVKVYGASQAASWALANSPGTGL